MEVQTLLAELQKAAPNTPVWIEIEGDGFLVDTVDHEEVGVVLRPMKMGFWSQA